MVIVPVTSHKSTRQTPTNQQHVHNAAPEESGKTRRAHKVTNHVVRDMYVRHTSGAMNSGVPQNVLVVFPNHISSLQRP